MNSFLSNINKVLDDLGLSAQKRAIHVQFTNPSLNSQVFLQRIDGQHAINEGVKAELICLSTNATIALKEFIGSQVSVDQVTDNGKLFRTTGIITEAAQGQSDGSLTLYKLTVEDATTLWHKRRNSRVFMNKSAVEVIETLFQEWQNKSPLFAASLSLDLSGLKQQYDVRPFIMQSNETDYDFLTRLMRSEGINWLIDEAQLHVPVSATPIEAQKLRLIDDNSQYQALDRRNIRFHRSSATEKKDSITSFIGQRSIQPTAVHVQRWQADVLEQEEGAGTVQSKHQHSSSQDNASLGLEQAWHFSPAWMQDLKGEDQATASSNSQIEKLNQNLSNYYNAQSKQFIASSTVRDTQVGYWFEINEHPEIDQHESSDKEFLITGKQYYNQNNLPKDLNDQINQLISQSNWNSSFKRDHDQEERQGNSLILQRRNIPTVPEYNPLQHRPTAHPQRARVVGPSGEEIHVDEWGRIKVRFLFSRAEDNQADGGAGSNNNDTDSAWVDVLTPWAGEGYGARFLPRIDEIVVIDFFDGNIDRPFVVGRIHEAQRSPTKFDIKGQLPDTKKLAGIRSKEVQGEGYGQLRFDDTTGQISTQLQNSHGASQLNLGNLSHPKETEQSEGRGEGFELRTDQWGGIRAGQGLLLSTYKQDQATGTHLDANEAKAQLETSLNNAKALSEVAKNQQTDPLEVIDSLDSMLKGLEVTKVAAIGNLVNGFKDSLASNPLNALQNIGGFVDQVGSIKGDVNGVIQQFNDSFKDAKQSIKDFEGLIKGVGQNVENYKDQLLSLQKGFADNPFNALKDAKNLFGNIQNSVNNAKNVGGLLQESFKNPLDSFKGLQSFADNLGAKAKTDSKSESEFKIFQNAMMVLAAPNSIALTTNEGVHFSVDKQIYETAGDSIQYSTQKSLITHAQSKISLFAAQGGARLYAGKGKVEIQAQGDAADLIARKGIQVISTEDKIEIKASKKIVLIAGGSQIEISSGGVLPTTSGKFEVKAGQHNFIGGGKIPVKNIDLPILNITNNLKPIECPIKSKLKITNRPAPISRQNNNKIDQRNNLVQSGIQVGKSHSCTTLLNPLLVKDYTPAPLSGQIVNADDLGALISEPITLNQQIDNGYIAYTDNSGARFQTRHYDYSKDSFAFDIKFDPKVNLIVATAKINFSLMKRVLKDKSGNPVMSRPGVEVELPYDSSFQFTDTYYDVIDEIDTIGGWFNFSMIKADVEAILNKTQFYFVPKNCSVGQCICKIPIKLEAIEDPNGYEVNVFKLSTRADSGNWSVDQALTYTNSLSSDDVYGFVNNGSKFNNYDLSLWNLSPRWEMRNIQAHETGHLFNWPDEYFSYGGAVHPMYVKPTGNPPYQIDLTITEPQDFWKRYSATNLMGAGTAQTHPHMQKYYFHQIKEWFELETGISWDVQS